MPQIVIDRVGRASPVGGWVVVRRYGGSGWGLATCDRGLPGRSGSWLVEPQMWEAPVSVNATSVGLDVHARSVVACGLDGRTGQLFERRMTPDHGDIVSRNRSLPGPVAVTYEAGPTGFGLARHLISAGIECLVAAPVRGSGQD
jgi:hypothetical protein